MKTRNVLFEVYSLFLVISVALLISLAPIAAASELHNEGTGSDSTSTNTLTRQRDISIEVINTGEVTNDFAFDLNSGGNTVKDNTLVGEVSTGDISLEGQVATQVNKGAEEITVTNGEPDAVSLHNVLTGPDSTSSNVSTVSNSFSFDLENRGEVTNSLDVNVNTGGNDIADNTRVGDVRTGAIDIAFAFESEVNITAPSNVPTPGPTSPPVGPPTPPQPTGQGGGPDLPLVSLIPGVGGADVSLPLSGGVGGAFFPAGASGLVALVCMATLLLFTPWLVRLGAQRNLT